MMRVVNDISNLFYADDIVYVNTSKQVVDSIGSRFETVLEIVYVLPIDNKPVFSSTSWRDQVYSIRKETQYVFR